MLAWIVGRYLFVFQTFADTMAAEEPDTVTAFGAVCVFLSLTGGLGFLGFCTAKTFYEYRDVALVVLVIVAVLGVIGAAVT